MKKIIVLIVLAVVIFFNYDKIDEIFFQMNLSQNHLNYDEKYFFDLNGDGEREEIKLESYKDKQDNFIVNLYINNKLQEKYEDENNISVHIYDFNKMDNKKEIYVILGDKLENSKINIFTYCNKNKKYNFKTNGRIINNDDKNGTMKITYGTTDDSANYNHYSKVIGGEPIFINYVYKRKLDCDFINIDKKEAQVVGISKENKYIVKDETIVYETNVGDVKAYTLLKGDKIKLVSLYNYDGNQCIKVVNEQGRYGWIKIEEKQIFEKK
ncbi:hypothetical protein [Terrisporobacter mayombei]|uniref:SH3b domain-containing protein n=1 Tax=Terrisporobacter mayombei TaxID=1541 RepID=A0ABY9Q2J9_9FIRM|nr:hypothetical protein [Terrisporobacter mayombei]MCC3867443.1 hypothetical protein [Terrisporobacter mayombei]WMT81703.1 hypothetical protein TEMA_20510 [Terrisporobacter mayombei]